MNEVEVERLVVSLVGDPKQYLAMMQQATIATQQAAQQMQGALKKTEEQAKATEGIWKGTVGALASLGAKNWLEGALGEWQNAESQSLKLDATLKANGRNVEELGGTYRAFASQMQELTVVDDDTVVGLLRMAETFDLTGNAATGAVQKAFALAGAVSGTAAAAGEYVRMAVALEKGDIAMAMRFARMIPQLRGIKDQTEFVAKANQLMAGGMATVTAEAQSSSGVLAQLKNDYGDFLEEIGHTVADGLIPVAHWLGAAVKWFQSLSPEVKTAITVVAILTAAVVALAGAIAVVGAIYNVMFAGSGILIGA